MKMTTATIKKLEALKNEARELAAEMVVIATNDGTYGNAECLKCTGNGDTKSGLRNVYERVGDGVKSTSGPSDSDAPGNMRHINAQQLKAKREQLAKLRAEIKTLE
jgi:hypothetical protein